MFTVKEWQDGEALKSVCARLGADYEEGDRAFVLVEGEPLAVGVLSLYRGTKVLIKGVYGDIDDRYRDLMCRSLLFFASNLSPITVRVNEVSDYYRALGFTETEGGMEVNNKEIRFEH